MVWNHYSETRYQDENIIEIKENWYGKTKNYRWKITKKRHFIKAETYKHIQQELSLDLYEDWDFLEP